MMSLMMLIMMLMTMMWKIYYYSVSVSERNHILFLNFTKKCGQWLNLLYVAQVILTLLKIKLMLTLLLMFDVLLSHKGWNQKVEKSSFFIYILWESVCMMPMMMIMMIIVIMNKKNISKYISSCFKFIWESVMLSASFYYNNFFYDVSECQGSF